MTDIFENASEEFYSTISELKTSNHHSSSFLKRAYLVDANGYREKASNIQTYYITGTSALILTHSYNEHFDADLYQVIHHARSLEKQNHTPLFVLLALTEVTKFNVDEFRNACKFAYTAGIDGILVHAHSADAIKYIRADCLGLRGRRTKIFVESCKDIATIQESDGVLIDSTFDPSFCSEILSRRMILFTRDPALTDHLNVDLLVSPYDSSTCPTTMPSTPTSTRSSSRSFLFAALLKRLRPSTKLIIALSEDGHSVVELSTHSRISKTRIPVILGLSASESVARFINCVYGVVPLQTQSFISVQSVIRNAMDFAKNKGLVNIGDEVVVVMHPPPVTASTNESCFEGIVQSRIVE